MARLVCPLLALVVALAAIAVSLVEPRADSAICVHGGCTFEDMMTTMEARGTTPDGLAALLRADSSNPHMWASYADFLAGTGDLARAGRAFAQAEATGPGLAPVLMRSANFAFSHDRPAHGLQLVPRILEQTSDFDEILFSYVDGTGLAPTAIDGVVIPAQVRPARAWAAWTSEHGKPEDVLAHWTWMVGLGLVDQPAAVGTVNALWTRQAYDDARRAWLAFTGDAWYADRNRLANPRFAGAPTGTPFDWDLSPRPGLEYSRSDGLALRFTGANPTDLGAVQHALVTPGDYTFIAEVSSDALSTDQGIFFSITDGEDAGRLHLQTSPVSGTTARTELRLDLAVPTDTRVLRVQLQRAASLKFDNKLTGTLHVHHVQLVPTVR